MLMWILNITSNIIKYHSLSFLKELVFAVSRALPHFVLNIHNKTNYNIWNTTEKQQDWVSCPGALAVTIKHNQYFGCAKHFFAT